MRFGYPHKHFFLQIRIRIYLFFFPRICGYLRITRFKTTYIMRFFSLAYVDMRLRIIWSLRLDGCDSCQLKTCWWWSSGKCMLLTKGLWHLIAWHQLDDSISHLSHNFWQRLRVSLFRQVLCKLLSSLLCLWQCFCFVLSSLTRTVVNNKLSLWRKKSLFCHNKKDTLGHIDWKLLLINLFSVRMKNMGIEFVDIINTICLNQPNLPSLTWFSSRLTNIGGSYL